MSENHDMVKHSIILGHWVTRAAAEVHAQRCRQVVLQKRTTTALAKTTPAQSTKQLPQVVTASRSSL